MRYSTRSLSRSTFATAARRRSRFRSRRRGRRIGWKLARHRRPERVRPRARALWRLDVFVPASRESRVLQPLGHDAVVKRELEPLFTVRERFRDVHARVSRSKRRARLVQGGDDVFISPKRPPRAPDSSKQGHRGASGHARRVEVCRVGTRAAVRHYNTNVTRATLRKTIRLIHRRYRFRTPVQPWRNRTSSVARAARVCRPL